MFVMVSSTRSSVVFVADIVVFVIVLNIHIFVLMFAVVTLCRVSLFVFVFVFCIIDVRDCIEATHSCAQNALSSNETDTAIEKLQCFCRSLPPWRGSSGRKVKVLLELFVSTLLLSSVTRLCLPVELATRKKRKKKNCRNRRFEQFFRRT